MLSPTRPILKSLMIPDLFLGPTRMRILLVSTKARPSISACDRGGGIEGVSVRWRIRVVKM